MEAKLCVLLRTLVSVSLGGSQVPTVSLDECPSDSTLNAIRSQLSEIVSDTLSVCGGPGWRRVAFLNMSDPNQTCPDQWRQFEHGSLRLCGRRERYSASCDSARFSTSGRGYTRVCGRIIGYQYNTPDAAFHYYYEGKPGNQINEPYIDGVSVTHGIRRKHIWSFFAAYTPHDCCSGRHLNHTRSLGFIGDNFFCDSAHRVSHPEDNLFTGHPLWGDLSSCTPHSGPWFYATLTVPSIHDIEVRLCADESVENEDTPLQLVEIYVK